MDKNERGQQSQVAPSLDLGQQIWGRYGRSPGTIPLTTTLGLARRISRFTHGRLPLLATIQRRWSPIDMPLAYRESSTPFTYYAGWPPLDGTVQRSTQPPFSGQQSGWQPSLPARPELQERTPLQPLQASADVRHEKSPSSPASMEQPRSAPEAGGKPLDLGQQIVQRHLRGAAGRVLQRQADLQTTPKGASGQSLEVRRIPEAGIEKPDENVAGAPGQQPLANSVPETASQVPDRTDSAPQAPDRTDSAPQAPDYDVARSIWQRYQAGPGNQIIQRLATISGRETHFATLPVVYAERAFPVKSAVPDLQRGKNDEIERSQVTEMVTTITQPPGAGADSPPLPVVKPERGKISMTDDGRSPAPAPAAFSGQADSPFVMRANIHDEAAEPGTIRLTTMPGEMRHEVQQRLSGEQSRPGSLVLRAPLPDRVPVSEASPLPLAISRASGNIPQIARQLETSVSTDEAQEAAMDGETSAEESKGAEEIDLEQLAEQVSRLLRSRLAIERERRGIGRWH